MDEYQNKPPQVKDTDESVNKEPQKSNLLGIGLALLLAVAAFYSGMMVTPMLSQVNSQTAGLFSFFNPAPKVNTDEVDLTQFWRVWQLMDEKFSAATSTDPLTNEERMYGAIDGLVRSYDDPYTVFLPPEENAIFAEDISGNFSGIGMEVGLREGVITIIAPLADTPADKAGLAAGDYIVRIDDVSTEGMRIDEAVRLIRGEKGTAVKLSIFRDGELDLKEFVVVRDTITVPTVKTKRDGDTFVIELFSFNAVSELRMQEALREYIKSGAPNLVLDLRGNPGGYLQSAVSIAGFFLPTGKVIVRERFSEGGEERLYRSQGRTLRDLAPKQLVILVDNGSASASEILAGALREHGEAVLIGVNTFGKGSVQELVELGGGSSLKVTVARWYTPDGVSISEGGLTPDYVIKRTPQQRLDDVDPQLEAALKLLQGEEIQSESTNAEVENN